MGAKSKKNTEFTDLVRSYPKMDIEDLRLALSSKIDIFTNIWIFGMGLIIALVAIAFQLPSDQWPIRAGLAGVAAGLFIVFVTRRNDPEKRLEQLLKETDYFAAKELVLKQEKDASAFDAK